MLIITKKKDQFRRSGQFLKYENYTRKLFLMILVTN